MPKQTLLSLHGERREVVMRETLSVLFANLDETTIKAVRNAIKDYASDMTSCGSIEAVLEALQTESVDVVLLDLQQPFESSFDLLSELKACSPQTEVVFVSRFDDEKLWVEAVQRGAYDFLPKPLEMSELRRVLVQATERHHPLKALRVTAS
jgi:DNA-binding NtrC family response regulator